MLKNVLPSCRLRKGGKVHKLHAAEKFCGSAPCVSDNPLQFSGSQLSPFRNEQLDELFPSPYGLTKAAQP